MILHIVAGPKPAPPTVPYVHPSLESEGFIHCCFDHQALKVTERFFPKTGEIWAFEIKPESLTSAVRVEPSSLGESFPHIYGPINPEAFGQRIRIR